MADTSNAIEADYGSAGLGERILAALEAYSVLDVATDMKPQSVLPLTSAKTLLTSNKTMLRPLPE